MKVIGKVVAILGVVLAGVAGVFAWKKHKDEF